MILPASVQDVKIDCLPNNAYYIADFISEEEEAALLRKIESAPKPRWKTLSHRRLQTWPSDLTKDTLIDAPLPQWLQQPVIHRILSIPLCSSEPSINLFANSPHLAPNHVLINEYLPGQGIMPHKDGPAYYPIVCTVSLGSSLCLEIYSDNDEGIRESEPCWRIFQEPRSLLITTGDLYTDYFHGIADITADENLDSGTVANWSLLRDPKLLTDKRSERAVRTSLTFRDVLKVSKIGNKFGGLFSQR